MEIIVVASQKGGAGKTTLLRSLAVAMQQAEGSYRAELTTFLRRSFHVSAARSEDVQKTMHQGHQ